MSEAFIGFEKLSWWIRDELVNATSTALEQIRGRAGRREKSPPPVRAAAATCIEWKNNDNDDDDMAAATGGKGAFELHAVYVRKK